MKPIIDSHLDLAWNALSWNRDLTRSVAEIRESEHGITDRECRGRNTVSLPDMRRGNIPACCATVLARSRPGLHPSVGFRRMDLDFGSPEITCAVGQSHLAYYRLLESRGDIRFITDAACLKSHMTAWESHPQSCPIGIILSMEGADPIVEPSQAQWWFEQGLRTVGLVHYGVGPYAVGTGENGPLTQKGIELLEEFQRLGMILDLTHCSDESFFEAAEQFSGPIFASHNNCRSLVPHDRQFTDTQIKLIISRGGVIGAALDSWMLHPNWKHGQTPRESVTLTDVVNHIDHVCQIAGNSNHCGIGSDLDGGFGTEQSPSDLDTIADLQKFDQLLTARGYSENDVSAILSGNFLRFFSESLPHA